MHEYAMFHINLTDYITFLSFHTDSSEPNGVEQIQNIRII